MAVSSFGRTEPLKQHQGEQRQDAKAADLERAHGGSVLRTLGRASRPKISTTLNFRKKVAIAFRR